MMFVIFFFLFPQSFSILVFILKLLVVVQFGLILTTYGSFVSIITKSFRLTDFLVVGTTMISTFFHGLLVHPIQMITTATFVKFLNFAAEFDRQHYSNPFFRLNSSLLTKKTVVTILHSVLICLTPASIVCIALHYLFIREGVNFKQLFLFSFMEDINIFVFGSVYFIGSVMIEFSLTFTYIQILYSTKIILDRTKLLIEQIVVPYDGIFKLNKDWSRMREQYLGIIELTRHFGTFANVKFIGMYTALVISCVTQIYYYLLIANELFGKYALPTTTVSIAIAFGRIMTLSGIGEDFKRVHEHLVAAVMKADNFPASSMNKEAAKKVWALMPLIYLIFFVSRLDWYV